MPKRPSLAVLLLLLLPVVLGLAIDRQFVGLSDWIISQGGFVGSVVAGSVDGLRGLFATDDVRSGEPLLAVPLHCAICATEGMSSLKLHEELMLKLLAVRSEGPTQASVTKRHTAEPHEQQSRTNSRAARTSVALSASCDPCRPRCSQASCACTRTCSPRPSLCFATGVIPSSPSCNATSSVRWSDHSR